MELPCWKKVIENGGNYFKVFIHLLFENKF